MTSPATRTHRRRPRARKGEGGALRDEILAATEGLLIETGDESSVSIRAVANAIGVSPPAIYRHFADKPTLLAEVCDRHFDRLTAYLIESTADIDDPVEAVRERGRAYVRFGQQNPEHYRIMFMSRNLPQPAQRDLLEVGCYADMVTVVKAAIDAGALRPEHTDPVAVTTVLWAAVHGITSLLVTKDDLQGPPADQLIEAVLDVQFRGLLTPAPAPEPTPPAKPKARRR